VTVEFRSEAKDGSIRWLEVRGRNLMDDRLIQGIMVNVRDITERKEREKTLERQRAFLDHSTDIITVLDAEGTIDYVSPSVERVLGYDPDELVGTPSFEMVHDDHLDEVMAAFSEMLAEPGGEAAAEFRMRTADGEWCWVDARGSNQLEDPVIEGVVINARDITERKEREREIEWQNERLEEFAEVVSHDLRNPLTVARSQLELGRRKDDNEHLGKVADAQNRIEELIDDLLTLAREGKDIGELQSVDLARLVGDCWQNVATGDGDIDVAADGNIEADPTRLRQLLENLIRNATEHGGDSITVGATEDGFYVEDDGPGIPKADREDVFEAGYSTADDGTGFGLTIVKQVAQAHGWEIEVTDGSSGGARFEISGVDSV
jgi:PAS domain S-box-containing protein